MGAAKDYKHDRQKDRYKNVMKIQGLLERKKELKYSELKRELNVSDPTLSDYIRKLEEMERIEHFFKSDRRERWYRIRAKSLKKVEASLRKYEAIQFIESISNPIYSYKSDGKKAIAAFVSLPVNDALREKVQRAADTIVSWNLNIPNLLKASPDKEAKIAVVIMISAKKEESKNEGVKP